MGCGGILLTGHNLAFAKSDRCLLFFSVNFFCAPSDDVGDEAEKRVWVTLAAVDSVRTPHRSCGWAQL